MKLTPIQQPKPMKILSSSNYSQFKFNPHQRTFQPTKVNDLARKMVTNGFPPSMAISVYRGKPFELIINTGHHRFAAAQKLGIPVLYIIEDQWTLQQMVDEGVTGSMWGLQEAAIAFAKGGNKDYADLLVFSLKGLPLSMAASLLTGEMASSGNARERVLAGTFKIKTREHARKFTNLFDEFADRIPAVKNRHFIACYSKCLLTPQFYEAAFLRRLKANPLMLEKTRNEEQMMKRIEEIYNFKSTNKIPLAFFVTKNSKERKDQFGKVAKS